MLPEWIIKILESMGVPGAIIFVLMLSIGGLVAVIKSMQKKADKIYGYRLTERDTLKDALNSTSKVLSDMLRATEDRNDLTHEQAELIAKQSAAFELLKVTILAQYENIKDNNMVVAQAVASMAEAIRSVTTIVQDNRHIAAAHVNDVKALVIAATNEIKDAVRASSQAQISDVRNLLGADLTIVQRRRKSPP
jgi:hypothetical protein